MKIIYEKWWDSNNKSFSIRNYKKDWKKVGNKPRFTFHENGGRHKYGDSCFDCSLIIGYTIINYTNFGLNGKNCNNCIRQHSNDCPNSSLCYSQTSLPYFVPKKNRKKNQKINDKTSLNRNSR
jgi:hypothetical protein